ncbi:NAD(P)-dependent oxidoreductase [Herbiconiux sp. 11R-BC]|uniref:NAD(P)-dependent oxidoreductase n=1 Tax=Herbiconiux sp. 11R-BC TaxID=3111637 RepID=UPI003C0237C2
MTTTTSLPRSATTGFIGLGNMGSPMAQNLAAGAPGSVVVTGRSRERARRVIDAGAAWAESPRELVDRASVVLLMVPDLPEVESLLLREDGLLASGADDAIVVVCSTVSADGIRSLAERVRAESDGRVRLVDAPVSGGTEGAEAATLSIMVGGETPDVDLVLPVLRRLGAPVHLGPLGAGCVAKSCNQMIVAATMTAIAEACVVAERSGLELAALLPVLARGYAGSRVLETKWERIVAHDYTLGGAAAYMAKDLRFASAAAAATATATPQLDALLGVFTDLTERGMGADDVAVIHRWVRETARI